MSKKPARIDYSRGFDKQLKKAPLEIKIAFRKKFTLFLENPFNPLLNNHSLTGKLKDFRSINITGDWRDYILKIKVLMRALLLSSKCLARIASCISKYSLILTLDELPKYNKMEIWLVWRINN